MSKRAGIEDKDKGKLREVETMKSKETKKTGRVVLLRDETIELTISEKGPPLAEDERDKEKESKKKKKGS